MLIIPTAMVMSSLYDISVQFQLKLQQRTYFVQDREVRRELESRLKACPLIRCQIGGLYHMEAQAKLTLLSQIINGVAGLLVNIKT